MNERLKELAEEFRLMNYTVITKEWDSSWAKEFYETLLSIANGEKQP